MVEDSAKQPSLDNHFGQVGDTSHSAFAALRFNGGDSQAFTGFSYYDFNDIYSLWFTMAPTPQTA